MATKTSRQIQEDVYNLLKNSIIADSITGTVCYDGYRRRDSRNEDAVVIFTTGLPYQIQTGIVTVHIYVPDKDPYGNGVFVEDGERTKELEKLAQIWVDSLTANRSCYKFKLKQTICTAYAKDIRQHFIVMVLGYKYFDE